MDSLYNNESLLTMLGNGNNLTISRTNNSKDSRVTIEASQNLATVTQPNVGAGKVCRVSCISGIRTRMYLILMHVKH